MLATHQFKKRLSISAAAMGTMIEWYDFMLFIYLTPYFSDLFFPHDNPLSSLLITFAVYASGFLMAPLGSLFFGSMGDRLGRKPALIVAISMMSIPMIVTALLPTYYHAGLIAPLLLVCCRLLQGFSIGGQYGGTMVYMIESAGPGYRGLTASIATMTSGAGVFLSSLIVTLLVSLTSHQQMHAWGWRIPYLFGFLLTIITFAARYCMVETEHFTVIEKTHQQCHQPLRMTFIKEFIALIYTTLLSCYANITYYLIASYLAIYMMTISKASHALSLQLITALGLVYAITAPFFGWLSDRLGRKSMLWSSIILFILLSYPAFSLLQYSDVWHLSFALLLLLLPLMLIWGAYGAQAPELFATQYRYCGTSISYNIGNSFCGGLTPFVATLLISLTGSYFAPMWLLIIPAICMIPVALKIPETADNIL